MLSIGYSLSSEEFGPKELVQQAQAAEQGGFEFAMISDHFHPWSRRQGHSPFAWSVTGAIAQGTEQIRIGTGVTCPIRRYHPALIAQAAATMEMLIPGRFILGLGTGENLNEHVVGEKWPIPAVRLEMLEEAVAVIEGLWEGELYSHHGKYFTVEEAQLFSRPEAPPPIFIAASKEHVAEFAGRCGHGMISTAPKKSLIEAFERAGGRSKPRFGQITMCWAPSEKEGQQLAKEIWPNALVSGEASGELPLPRHFEQVTEDMGPEMMTSAGQVTCGPSAEKHLEAVRKFIEAGFDHVYIHQIGPQQMDFIRFAQAELIPELRNSESRSGRMAASVDSSAEVSHETSA
jgi:G6PDH family F420-dependent oxidoreductase